MYKNVPNQIDVVRYHSWIVDKLPINFNITAETLEGDIMSFENELLMIDGVQYHPESSPGPHDSRYLFDDFINKIKND